MLMYNNYPNNKIKKNNSIVKMINENINIIKLIFVDVFNNKYCI
jgi:hypothetical protein